MNKPKPLKKFGQNYLVDKNIILKIVNEINPQKNDNIIEIGPGRGALTEYLVDACKNVNAVEIDTRVIEDLSARFPTLNIKNMDFLKSEIKTFSQEESQNLRVVGNIPYNITSPIIFKMFENRTIIKDSILMVQYEVAKRMTANKGSKDYGILRVLLSYFTETKLCFKISPNVFQPRPNVDSAIVHIKFKNFATDVNDLLFIKVVKASFGNRRKTLKNSLSNSIFRECDFLDCPLDLSQRAEQLEVENFVELTKFIQGKQFV